MNIFTGKLQRDPTINFYGDCRETIERPDEELLWRLQTDCRETLERLQRDHRETIERLQTDCRETVDRLQRDCRGTIERLQTDCRQTVDRLQTDCRGTIERPQRDCRQTVERLQRDCRETLERPQRDPTMNFYGDCIFDTRQSVKYNAQYLAQGLVVWSRVGSGVGSIYSTYPEMSDISVNEQDIDKWAKVIEQSQSWAAAKVIE